MPMDETLRIVGWTSEYRSVNKWLKKLKKITKKADDQNLVAQQAVDSVSLVCRRLGKDPDRLIKDAAGRKPGEDYEAVQALIATLNERGATEEEMNIRISHIIVFLDANKRF